MARESKIPMTVGGNRVVLDLTPGVEASLPAASAILTGARYRTTDTGVVLICDGSAWAVEDYDASIGWNGGSPLYESVRRDLGGGATGAQALATGVAQANGIFLPKGAVLSKLAFWYGSTAFVPGSTSGFHWYYALYTPALALACYTADFTNTVPSINRYDERAITKDAAAGTIASYTVPASGIYYIDVMFAIGTGGAPAVPTLRGQNTGLAGLAAGGDNSGNGLARMKSMAFTHGTTLTYPPPATITTRTNIASPDWVAAY